jgi:EAL domain-containing protein (putative c-di-GMP-specific phosphodiesterase class I)
LPIDLLKIDQSFVRDILTDSGDAMMVQTISGMAHNFGFGVIKEGVEQHAQYRHWSNSAARSYSAICSVVRCHWQPA